MSAAIKTNVRNVHQRLTSSRYIFTFALLFSHLLDEQFHSIRFDVDKHVDRRRQLNSMTKIIDETCENQNGFIESTTVFRRHSKGPVMFNGCSPAGDMIIIDNISQKKTYDLTGWYIERQTDLHSFIRYSFPDHYLLPPLTTVELCCETDVQCQIDSPSENVDNEQKIVRLVVPFSTWNRAEQWSRNHLYDLDGFCRAQFSHRTLPMNEKENFD